MNTTKHMPFFSVIIPLYNKEGYIESTLNSVLKQSFKDFEIIIIDDGSTDKSLEIISKFEDDRLTLFKQKNSGASVARNNGIEKAKGKYISLLDADDSWYTNHLLELKKQIDLFPDAGLFCNNYEIYFSENLVRPAKLNFEYKNDCLIVKDFFLASITLPVAWTSAVGFSKEKFNLIGGFQEKFSGAEDLDLWIRFALNYNVAFNPVITMSYKLYVDDSLSTNEFNSMRYDFIKSFNKEEKTNTSLKLYLDINRYALAIRCLLNNEDALYKRVKKEINYNNLNIKQKLLLNCPKTLLKLAKQCHLFLVKNGLYFSANS
ncbi:glycosyltransferase family 2 protein [Algibacter sp.]|uniref:glycosyltransferase family 2 protein n=1 Tax=Algibacter sp. TaxID=1872428 RepID=UPI003C73E205